MAGGELRHGLQLLPGGRNPDLDPGDLPEPAIRAGPAEAVTQAGEDSLQPGPLGGAGGRRWAADSGAGGLEAVLARADPQRSSWRAGQVAALAWWRRSAANRLVMHLLMPPLERWDKGGINSGIGARGSL